jgi:anti-anti-sigma factor
MPVTASLLTVTVKDGPEGPVLVLEGLADFSNFQALAEVLHGHIADHGSSRLVVDAEALSYVDSLANRVLGQAARVLRDRGGQLILVRPTPAVLAMLQITGTSTLMHIQA